LLPLFLISGEFSRRNERMKAIIKAKDAEIACYKKTGVKIAKAAQTQPFDDELFHKTMSESQEFQDSLSQPLKILSDPSAEEIYNKYQVRKRKENLKQQQNGIYTFSNKSSQRENMLSITLEDPTTLTLEYDDNRQLTVSQSQLYSDDEDNQLSQTSDSLSQSQPDKPAEQQKKDFTESPEELEQREQIQNKLKREREKKKKKQNASKKKRRFV